jgi:hypothetical protein
MFVLEYFKFYLKAIVYITKNDENICTIWVESLAMIHNDTIAWGWSSGSIDCLIHCQIGDKITATAAYRLKENFNSQIYGYSYSTFSGYMLFNL